MNLLYLLADLVILFLSTRELMLCLRLGSGSIHSEHCIAFGLLASMQIVVLSLVLGYTGNYNSFFITLGLLLIYTIARCSRPSCQESSQVSRSITFQTYEFGAKLGCYIIVAWVAILFISAAFSYPLNYDSQCYRLSRIGYWLQEGDIGHFLTGDDRQSYSGYNGDLIMMWLIGHFPSGYPFSNLVQAFAGLLLLCSVWFFSGLLRLSTASKVACLLALFTVPSFVAQFTTSQNDLIVAAFIFAGLAFFTRAIIFCNLKDMLLGCIGIALACGTKGTVFYWGPGLALFAFSLLAVFRPPFLWLVKSGGLAFVCLLILGSPRYFENWFHLGNPFGSPEHVEMVHGERTFGLEKLSLNIASLFVQNIAPISNSFLINPISEPVAVRLASAIPEDINHDNVISGKRKVYLERVINLSGKYAASDYSSIGIILTVAMALALFFCLRSRRELSSSRRPTNIILGALILSVILYVIFFAALFKYQPYTSRYFLMLAPVGALSIGYLMDRMKSIGAMFAFYLILIAAVSVAGETYFNGSNSGFQNLFDSSSYRTRMVSTAQKNIILEEMEEGENLAYNLGSASEISAGLYRNKNGVKSYYVDIEKIQDYESIEAFMINEGFDALILSSKKDFSSGDLFRRSYAHEGNSRNSNSFVFYGFSETTPNNAYVSDFNYWEGSGFNAYEWKVLNAEGSSVSVLIRNMEDNPLDVLVVSGVFQVRKSVAQNSEYRIELDTMDGDSVTVYLNGRDRVYELELEGATPLINPFEPAN